MNCDATVWIYVQNTQQGTGATSEASSGTYRSGRWDEGDENNRFNAANVMLPNCDSAVAISDGNAVSTTLRTWITRVGGLFACMLGCMFDSSVAAKDDERHNAKLTSARGRLLAMSSPPS